MLVPFSQLPSEARVWVFQSSRQFTAREVSLVDRETSSFLNEWEAHGQPLTAAYELPYHHFLVIGADQTVQKATGCSIDRCHEFVQTLGKKLRVDFFDRLLVAFLLENNVLTIPTSFIKEYLDKGIISPQTITFNNLVQTKDEYEKAWLVPMKDTWLKKYLSDVPLQFSGK